MLFRSLWKERINRFSESTKSIERSRRTFFSKYLWRIFPDAPFIRYTFRSPTLPSVYLLTVANAKMFESRCLYMIFSPEKAVGVKCKWSTDEAVCC